MDAKKRELDTIVKARIACNNKLVEHGKRLMPLIQRLYTQFEGSKVAIKNNSARAKAFDADLTRAMAPYVVEHQPTFSYYVRLSSSYICIMLRESQTYEYERYWMFSNEATMETSSVTDECSITFGRLSPEGILGPPNDPPQHRPYTSRTELADVDRLAEWANRFNAKLEELEALDDEGDKLGQWLFRR